MIATLITAGFVTVALAGPAHAGSHTWNYEKSHWHGSTNHGQYSLSGQSAMRAFTKHSDWADLRVTVRWTQNGQTVYQGPAINDDVVSITTTRISSHYSEW
ncbi:hypothetical protein [Demequina flava]|uniref:hypothetical protein n=1 Tax=Demequina flava TaxID=1095025 RepID=UPI00128D4847|nr:hypothetical protein [Demequina flava]